MANKPLKSVQFPGLDDTYTIPQVDNTLAVTGAAADSKKVGDEITELKEDFNDIVFSKKSREDWELGNYNAVNGSKSTSSIMTRLVGYVGVSLGTYTFSAPSNYLFAVFAWNKVTGEYIGCLRQSGSISTTGTIKYINGEYGFRFDDYPNYLFRVSVCKSGDVVLTEEERASIKFHVSNFTTDKTLIESDAPADAKTVGDALATKADKSDVYESYITDTASGSIASFPDGADNVPVKDLTVQIEPVQSGTGDPSPENVRPISGWTGCNISRSGLNLASTDSKYFKQLRGNTATYSDGTITTSSGSSSVSACGMLFPIKPGVTYYYRYIRSAGGTSYPWVRTYEVKPTDYNSATVRKLKNENSSMETNGIISGNFTAQENERYLFIGMYKSSSSAAFTLTDFTLGVGAFATDSPYNGAEYPITFPTEAGTVYDGSVDVTNGVLARDIASFNVSSLNWQLASDYAVFFAEVGANYKAVAPLSNIYKGVSSASGNHGAYDKGNYTVCMKNSGDRIYVRDDRYTTVADFKAAIAEAGLQILAYRTTPVTYQLTPQEVSTLLGLNNIWADCGDVEVDYLADTKLYIENLTAPSEDDMVANTNIPDATYFMVGNTLYLSTTTIPAGDTINPGTNCTKMDLAAALNAINS